VITAEKEKTETSSEIGQCFRLTNQAFEQDSKRRIGQYEGEGGTTHEKIEFPYTTVNQITVQ
jgi:hypothetical protein